MDHLQPFNSRRVIALPLAKDNGWQLKRYAILAEEKNLDNDTANAALSEAYERLPDAGTLQDGAGNHGVGFQIVHFAEVAVVSPVFYWQWGSVLANVEQIRAKWETPTTFRTGVKEVVGCIWEMEIVCFEIHSWKNTLLNNAGTPARRVETYLDQYFSG